MLVKPVEKSSEFKSLKSEDVCFKKNSIEHLALCLSVPKLCCCCVAVFSCGILLPFIGLNHWEDVGNLSAGRSSSKSWTQVLTVETCLKVSSLLSVNCWTEMNTVWIFELWQQDMSVWSWVT